MTNVVILPVRARPREKPAPATPRPSFGTQAKAIMAMELAVEILKRHESTIARMAREFADCLDHLDPKSTAYGHLFISAHMLIEDVKAFQASAAVESS